MLSSRVHAALVCLAVVFVVASAEKKVKELEVIKLEAGVHEISSFKYYNAQVNCILINKGRLVRIEGAGKGKTVIKGGIWLRDNSKVELVDLTIENEITQFSVASQGSGSVVKLNQCEIRGSKLFGVYVSDGGRAELRDSSIHESRKNGVVVVHKASSLDMQNCFLWQNKQQKGDYVSYLNGASPNDSTVLANMFGNDAVLADPMATEAQKKKTREQIQAEAKAAEEKAAREAEEKVARNFLSDLTLADLAQNPELVSIFRTNGLTQLESFDGLDEKQLRGMGLTPADTNKILRAVKEKAEAEAQSKAEAEAAEEPNEEMQDNTKKEEEETAAYDEL